MASEPMPRADQPTMLPFEPGRQRFVQGWGVLAIGLLPASLLLGQVATVLLGVDPDGRAAAGAYAAALAVVSLAGFLLGGRIQTWDTARRTELYERDRLPDLKRTAAVDAYGKGSYADLEEAWEAVEEPAMRWFTQEIRVVREVYRNYHRLFWLPAHYVVPGLLGLFAIGLAVQAATGLGF